MKYYRPCLFLVIAILFSACNPDSKSSTNEGKISSSENKRKVQIKEFWKTYREAQQLRKENKWLEAVDRYNKAIEIDSTHEDSWFNLGNMYLELNENKKARDCWKHIIHYNPGSARAHMQLGRLYLAHEREEVFNIDSAEVEFKATFELNKVVTGPLMLLGHVALIKGEVREAQEFYKLVAASDARSVEARFLLGFLAKDSDDSKDYFQQAIALSEPEKAVKGVLSEGDTKDGESLLRPINQSLFHVCFQNLAESEDTQQYQKQMHVRFTCIQNTLSEIRSAL